MKWPERTETVILFVLSAFVFLPNGISSVCLILLVVLRMVSNPTGLLPSRRTLALLTPAGIILLGWILGGFAKDGLRELQIWATWLGALIYFQSTPADKSNQFRHFFLISSLIGAFYFLVFLTFNDPFSSPSIGQNIRDAIEVNFHIHPTYLSAIWAMALLILWLESTFEILTKMVATLILLLALAFSGGKMPLIALIACALVFIALYSKQGPRRKWAIGIGAILVLSSLFVSPVLKERFTEIASVDLNYEEGDLLSSTELRLGIWNCSYQMIKEHALFGVGVGHTRSCLESCYESFNQVEFFEGEYNTHNQFMHFWLTTGVIGFSAFLIFTFGLIGWAVRSRNPLLVVYSIFFILILLTENYLLRQKGMMLYAFIIASSFYRLPEISDSIK